MTTRYMHAPLLVALLHTSCGGRIESQPFDLRDAPRGTMTTNVFVEELRDRCVARLVSNCDGVTPCSLFEAFPAPTRGDCRCEGSGQVANLAAFDGVLSAHEAAQGCGAATEIPCDDVCICERTQLPYGCEISAGDAGWCYVDPAGAEKAGCSSGQGFIEIVGAPPDTAGAAYYLGCLGVDCGPFE